MTCTLLIVAASYYEKGRSYYIFAANSDLYTVRYISKVV